MDSHTPTSATEPLTELLGRIEQGDAGAEQKFCARVYDELLAIAQRRRRSPGESMMTTDIVNDFLAQLLADGRLGQMRNRRYFFATAIRQMRRLIIDRWRARQRIKRGGEAERVDLESCLDDLVDSTAARCGHDLGAFDEALGRLTEQQRSIVELLFIGGLTHEQAGAELGLSAHQVKRQWWIARARLKLQLERSE